MTAPRYAVGIDLGTTHCAASYVDLEASEGERAVQHILAVPQLTSPGAVEELPLLPSFLYLPHATELAPGDLTLPWAEQHGFAVGENGRHQQILGYHATSHSQENPRVHGSTG